MYRFADDAPASGSSEPSAPTYRFADDTPTYRFASEPKAKPGEYHDLAVRIANEVGLRPDVFTKQIAAESSWNPRAKSPVGAMGLGQLMPATAKELGVSNPWDPEQNLRGAARYLKAKIDKYGGDYARALAAYNGGDEAVAYLARHGTLRGYGKDETYNYVQNILGAQPTVQAKPANPLADMMHRLNMPVVATAEAGTPYRFADEKPARPTPKPQTPQRPAYNFTDATNPMDTTGKAEGNPLALSEAHSALNEIAGHQDLPFILYNASLRSNKSIIEQLRDPNSDVSKAWALYRRDPAKAMDEYGAGSPRQNAFMAAHPELRSPDARIESFLSSHPKTNAAATFLAEMVNPLALAEGGVAGKAVSAASRIGKVADTAQGAARAAGLGSPLYELEKRGGPEASQWAKGLIASIKLHDREAKKVAESIFGGLTNEEQREVVRLSQGLKPDPKFFSKSGDLFRRATALRADIAHVTNEQVRVGRLRDTIVKNGKMIHGNVYDRRTYFPMSKSKELTDREELLQTLRGYPSNAGAGDTARMQKKFATLDDWLASGKLDKDFSPPENYATFRRQRMQHVAFEDAMERAPKSLAIASTPASRAALAAGQGAINGRPYVAARDVIPNANEVLRSPKMRRSLLAPELWKFYGENGQFAKYVDRAGSMLPGEENSFGGRLVSLFRTAIVSNPLFHPAVNVAGNDAAARGLHGLGGPVWEAGGYGENAAKAVALQIGLKNPEDFVGGAKAYASWMDRALKAGAIAEFGTPRTSMLGGDRMRVVTEVGGPWRVRLDRALTKAADWNVDRTFGDKGEAAFAVSLFKDAVERGKMSDADAGRVVREALGDYYNFDPKSRWSAAVMFMPWMKSNTKFWTNVLVRRPQYVTGPQHAIRNFNMQQGDPAMESPFAPPDFRVFLGSDPATGAPRYWTPPFVGRDVAKVANVAGSVLHPNPHEGLYNLDALVSGRLNPFARAAADAIWTLAKAGTGAGPETDYHMIENPQAPGNVQVEQTAKYLASHFIPIPLFSYAVEDAVRKGLDPHELGTALLTAAGAGYGSESLSDAQRRVVSRAKKRYLRAYYAWEDDHDDAELRSAWDDYVADLRGAGVLH